VISIMQQVEVSIKHYWAKIFHIFSFKYGERRIIWHGYFSWQSCV